MDKLIIEKISEENFNDFIYLIEKLAEYEKLEPPAEEAKARLKEDGLCYIPKYEAYLGKVNTKYVSYLIFYMTYSSFLAMPTLFLEDIFVLEGYRKRGIGQKMFNFCINQAKAKNCGRIELCVLSWNKLAIKFYQKNKLQCLDWKFYRLNILGQRNKNFAE